MRASREQAAENRQRIVETASRMYREHGCDGVGVDAIMNGAGLTHGGFYGHFRAGQRTSPAPSREEGPGSHA
jgi:TetR/AcrR family transcriptional regulator, transcriptional repressor for nem operon